MLAFEEFLEYKTRVPVRGAIMLNKEMDSVLLVKGWKKSAHWSFPRGKINKDEDDLDCAIREVYEETGYDIREAGLVPDPDDVHSIEITMQGQHMKLFVFRDIPMDTHFEPRTRKEISKIEWFRLSELPAFKKKKQQQGNDIAAAATNANKFYMVAPFIVRLKKWVVQQKKQDGTQPGPSIAHLPTPTIHEEPLTEDDYVEVSPQPGTEDEAAADMARAKTLESATAALHRLLKIQPATQGLQTEVLEKAAMPSKDSGNKDTGSALLSLLRGSAAPTTTTAQTLSVPGFSSSSTVPITPLEMTFTEAAQPKTPHHKHPQPMRYSSMPEVPPFPTHRLAQASNQPPGPGPNNYSANPPQTQHMSMRGLPQNQLNQYPYFQGPQNFAQRPQFPSVQGPQPGRHHGQMAFFTGGPGHGPTLYQQQMQMQQQQMQHNQIPQQQMPQPKMPQQQMQQQQVPQSMPMQNPAAMSNPQFPNTHAPAASSHPAPSAHSQALLNMFTKPKSAASDLPLRNYPTQTSASSVPAPTPVKNPLASPAPNAHANNGFGAGMSPAAHVANPHASSPNPLRAQPTPEHKSLLLDMFMQTTKRDAAKKQESVPTSQQLPVAPSEATASNANHAHPEPQKSYGSLESTPKQPARMWEEVAAPSTLPSKPISILARPVQPEKEAVETPPSHDEKSRRTARSSAWLSKKEPTPTDIERRKPGPSKSSSGSSNNEQTPPGAESRRSRPTERSRAWANNRSSNEQTPPRTIKAIGSRRGRAAAKQEASSAASPKPFQPQILKRPQQPSGASEVPAPVVPVPVAAPLAPEVKESITVPAASAALPPAKANPSAMPTSAQANLLSYFTNSPAPPPARATPSAMPTAAKENLMAYFTNPQKAPAVPTQQEKLLAQINFTQQTPPVPTQKETLLALFGKGSAPAPPAAPAAAAAAPAMARNPSIASIAKDDGTSRRGSQNTISSSDKSFLLGYLNNIAMSGSR